MSDEWYSIGKDIQEIKSQLNELTSSQKTFGPLGIGIKHKTHLDVSNYTQRDLWIMISGDANPSVGPQQVNNGNSIGADSGKIEFGNKAKFHVDIWRNANGQQGSYIGGYDTGVRFNALGYSDLDNLLIVTIGGTTYLQAISTRDVGALLAQLLLGD
ncbi:MAG: hypothetical protein ACYDEF_14485 [Methanosarcina sp.]|nr:hypothetical protein BGV40_02715 [Methanosarcina sp. Ant1]